MTLRTHAHAQHPQIINDTHSTCSPPPSVPVPGPGLLSVCSSNAPNGMACGPQSKWDCCQSQSNAVRVTYIELAGVVIGRRPYISETVGALLVSTHPSLAGLGLGVHAWLPFLGSGSTGWRWPLVPTAGNGSAVLTFDLSGLPATLNCDLGVTITIPNRGNVTKYRRLMRAPPLPATSATVTSQVDHHSRAIRIGQRSGVGEGGSYSGSGTDGNIFTGSGWFISTPTWPPLQWHEANTSTWVAAMSPRAAMGTLNQIMPYSLQTLPPKTQRAFLDACAELGIKVLYPMNQLGFTALGGTIP